MSRFAPLSGIHLIISFTITTLAFVTAIAPSKAVATPTAPTPQLDGKDEPAERATESEIERSRMIQISPAPEVPASERERDYFYRYRQALTIRGGAILHLNDTQTPGSSLGFHYRYSGQSLRRYEGGADLGNDGTGTLHLAKFDFDGDEKFRWFTKAGAGIRIVPKDELVTFLKLANWQLRLSAGFDWTVSDPVGLRFDIDGIATTERISINSTIGVSFGW